MGNIYNKQGDAKMKYELIDNDNGLVSTTNTVDEAKDWAKMSFGINKNFWDYHKEDKCWYTMDGGIFSISKKS